MAGERLLFVCEKVNLAMPPFGGMGPNQAIVLGQDAGWRASDEVRGQFVITDRRFLLVGKVRDGFYSTRPGIIFRSIFDPEYARQVRREILVSASIQKHRFLIGQGSGEYVLLRRRHFTGTTFGMGKEDEWELRLRAPMVEVQQTETGTEWFAPLLARFGGEADAGFEPVLEIARLKTPSISILLKELESGRPPLAASQTASVATPSKTGTWLDSYLEPGEQVLFQSLNRISAAPLRSSLRNLRDSEARALASSRAVITDKRLLLYPEHGSLNDGQKVLSWRLDEITSITYFKVPFGGSGALRFQVGEAQKWQLGGYASEMEAIKRLLENRDVRT